jgi:transposase-like protein
MTNVISLSNSFIAVVFKYQQQSGKIVYTDGIKGLDPEIIEELRDHKISAHLSSQRIIKLYPKVDTILLIKPNQLRYWISLTAYRDADKCLVDFINAGY